MRYQILAVLLSLCVVGCATSRKKDAQIQELQGHVSSLESELERKEDKIKSLQTELDSAESSKQMNQGYVETTAPKKEQEAKSAGKPTGIEIQTALKKAGYFKGTIDGKMGRKTRKAIKAFQKAQGLKADGVVGKRTWLRLKKYL